MRFRAQQGALGENRGMWPIYSHRACLPPLSAMYPSTPPLNVCLLDIQLAYLQLTEVFVPSASSSMQIDIDD